MDTRLGQNRIEVYFRTFNAGDEAAHLACFHPDVLFFASGSGDCQGVVAVRGVYRSAKEGLDLLEMHPAEIFGLHPELAVRAEIRGKAKCFFAILVFRLDEEGLIRRLSVLYNLRDAFPTPS